MFEYSNDFLFFWAMMVVAITVLVVMTDETVIIAGIRRIRARNRRRWIQLDWDHEHNEFVNLHRPETGKNDKNEIK